MKQMLNKGNLALAVGILAGVFAVEAATTCNSTCQSNQTSCCIKYANGNVAVDACCSSSSECKARKAGTLTYVTPNDDGEIILEAGESYGAIGCL